MAYGEMYDPNGNHLSDMTSQIKDDLTQTLRSVRDTLSTSFQTLNLTMSSIHSTLRTMSSAFVPQGGAHTSPNMIPSFGTNVNTGSMSGPMGQHVAQSSMWGLATGVKPFNVGGYEWAWERQKEMNHRFTQFGVDAGLGIPGLAAGSLASMTALKYAGRSAALGGAVRATGMAGTLARGAIGGIPGMAVSMGVDQIAGHWSDAANEYGRDLTGIRRMSTHFGNEFTNAQSGTAARGMAAYSHREMMQSTDFDSKLGIDGMRTVAMQGLQMNLFQGRKPEELVKQMESAAGVVKFLTGVLGSKDVAETMRYVGQMKNMGINLTQNHAYATKLGIDAHKYGTAMGVPGSELLGQATQIGANAYSQYGMPSFGGIAPAMQSMALAHEMEKRKILSTAEIASGGGHNNIAGQMVGFTAGLTNHSGVGKMMLAAGWQGGGKFSADKMNSSIKGGGYFGAVDNALSSIAGDPDKYADFMMNLENLQAGAAEQGGLDANTESMLFAALDQMGTFKNDNTAAMMLKKLAEQMGAPLSTSAAKAIVMKHRKPATMKSINREQNRGVNRGFHAQNALEYSPFRALGRLDEAIEKIGPDLKYNIVTKPAQWMRDTMSGIIGEPDEQMMGTGAGQFNQFTMDNYDHNMGGPSPNRYTSNDDDFNRAYRAGKNSLMLGKGATGDKDMPLWMQGNSRHMLPAMEGMLARQHKDYYKAMLDPNGMGTHESLNSVSDLLNGSESSVLSKYRSDGSGDFDKGGSKYWNVLGGGTQFLADNMSSDKINEMARATTGSQWYANLKDGEANDILSNAGIDRSKYNDSNAMMTRLLDDQNGELAKQAKSRGISSRNLAYGIVSSSYGQDGINNLSNYNKLMGANDEQYKRIDKAGGALARAEGHTFGAEKWAAQADNTMGLTGDSGTSTLKALGLSMDDIRDIVNTQGGRAQLDAFADAASRAANGEDVGKNFGGVTHPILKGALEKILEKKEGFVDSIKGDSIIGFGASGDFDTKIHKFMGGIGNAGSLDNAKTALGDMGFDGMDDEGIKTALSNRNMGKYASGLRGTTEQSKALKAKLNEVGAMSLDGLHEQYGDLTKGKNLEDARNAVMNDMATTTKQDITAKNADKDIQKSMIDTTVDTNLKAVRTVEVDRGIRDAAEKVRGVGSTSVPNGYQTPGTSGNAKPNGLPSTGAGTSTSSTPIADWFKSKGW